jgi:hypothetical protein
MATSASSTGSPGLFQTLRADFKKTFGDARRTGYGRTVSQTVSDLETYYLSEADRQILAQMNAFKRFFVRVWWLFKALIFKLSPSRRVLLAFGLIALLFTFGQGRGAQSNPHWALIGMGCVLLVLMLELREKLVAHDELAEGRAIQKALLPKTTPSIAGFQVWLDTTPANDVGGDIVDVLQVNSDRFFLLLGDVAGKGLGAALLAARLQATFRALAPDSATLAAVGDQLNRIFHRDGPSNRFATVVGLSGQPGHPTLRLLNAGHPSPLIAHQGDVSAVPAGGPALGIIGGAKYSEHEVTLAPGDTLLVYSDGVTEAMNADGDLFGEERLIAAFKALCGSPVAELGRALQATVRQFEAAERPHDDLSLIVVRLA